MKNSTQGEPDLGQLSQASNAAPLPAMDSPDACSLPDGIYRDFNERPKHKDLRALPTHQLPVADYGVMEDGRWTLLIEHKSMPDLYFLAIHDEDRRARQAELARQHGSEGTRILLVDALPEYLSRWNQTAAKKALRIAGLPRFSGRQSNFETVMRIAGILQDYESSGWQVVMKPAKLSWDHFGDFVVQLLQVHQQHSGDSALAAITSTGIRAYQMYRAHLSVSGGDEPPCVRRLRSTSGMAEFKKLSGNGDVSRTTACELLKLFAAAQLHASPLSPEDSIARATDWGRRHGIPFTADARVLEELHRSVTGHSGCLGCVSPGRRGALVKYGICHNPGSCIYGLWKHGTNAHHRQLPGSALAAVPGLQAPLETIQKLIDFARAVKGTKEIGHGFISLDVPAVPALNALGIRQRKTLERHLGIAQDWGLIATEAQFNRRAKKQRIRVLLHEGLFTNADTQMLNWHMALYQTLLLGVAGPFKAETQRRLKEERMQKRRKQRSGTGRQEHHTEPWERPLPSRPLHRAVPWLSTLMYGIEYYRVSHQCPETDLSKESRSILAEWLGDRKADAVKRSWMRSASRLLFATKERLESPIDQYS